MLYNLSGLFVAFKYIGQIDHLRTYFTESGCRIINKISIFVQTSVDTIVLRLKCKNVFYWSKPTEYQ